MINILLKKYKVKWNGLQQEASWRYNRYAVNPPLKNPSALNFTASNRTVNQQPNPLFFTL